MSNLTDFFPSGGGGGLTPKFQEFNASGTFTPSQALIDAGGYIELFLVAGGGAHESSTQGAYGGEVLIKKMYLNTTTGISINIGSGAVVNDTAGGDSIFLGASAGGSDFTAKGGKVYYDASGTDIESPSWGANAANGAAGNGVFGYGAGGGARTVGIGIYTAKANTGQGGRHNGAGASGYCLIKWYE